MNPVRTNGRFKALTLIEVIVVIAVMVLFIELVLQALGRAKARGSRISCATWLKQVGLAARIFANDNDDRFPWQTSTNRGGSREYQDEVSRLPRLRCFWRRQRAPVGFCRSAKSAAQLRRGDEPAGDSIER